MDIAELLPHAFPMIMVHEIIEANTTGSTVMAHITATNPYLYEHVLHRAATIELLAQGFAVGQGSLLGAAREKPQGYLAAINSLQVYQDIYEGDHILVKTKLVTCVGAIFVVEGSLWRETTLVAAGSLKIFVPAQTD